MGESTPIQDAIKDELAAHPVPTAWRHVFEQVVHAFVRGNYAIHTIPSVAPIDAATPSQIRNYIAEYGETLTDLPESTWATSVSQWMLSHWEVLVDLSTVQSGTSDLVLAARVHETADGFVITVDSVHVP